MAENHREKRIVAIHSGDSSNPMQIQKTAAIKKTLFLTGILFLLIGAFPANAADEYNCMMCHKYRFIGRIDSDGKRWNYHVDEFFYSHSVHRKIECIECHTYITKIPHAPVTQGVDCATECHTKPPFAQDKFSHKKIVEIFNGSVHKIGPEDPEVLKNAQPNCKFCHLNPVYTQIPESVISYQESLSRCYNCHQPAGVTQAYKHIAHRFRQKTSRSSLEIVQLCAKCHDDDTLMKNLNVSEKVLSAVKTYNRSIHGKLVSLGSRKAADCISCHASNALHDIYKKENEKATIHKSNLTTTCNQCHKNTNRLFVKIAVHPDVKHEESPIIRLISLTLGFALYGSVLGLVGLMLFETFGRRRDGIKFMFRKGSSWRGKSKGNFGKK